MKSINTKFLTHSALLLALGVLFPFFFHQYGIAGRIFLPMHIPVLIAGFLVGPASGGLVGALSPILSSLLTGMPTLPLTILMVPELLTYGILAGLLYQKLRVNLWLSLLGAMGGGRIIWTMMAVLISPILGIRARTLPVALAALAASWPGMIIQLIFIPSLVERVKVSRQ